MFESVRKLNMSIDPTTMIWLNVLYAFLTGLSAATLQAAGISHAQEVVAWAGLIAFPINLILHAFSSTNPGPLAPPDVPK